jgi:hypothetical protein
VSTGIAVAAFVRTIVIDASWRRIKGWMVAFLARFFRGPLRGSPLLVVWLSYLATDTVRDTGSRVRGAQLGPPRCVAVRGGILAFCSRRIPHRDAARDTARAGGVTVCLTAANIICARD